MTNVVLVCVAGVSGTFLARRMRQLDPTLTVTVTPVDSFASAARMADVVLVAPQVAGLGIADLTGVPHAVLAPDAYGPGGADAAVRLVHDLKSPGSSWTPRADTAATKE